MLEFIFDGDATTILGPEEFCAMKGMRFTRDDHLPEESEFHQRVYNGKRIMFLYDIYTKFLEECLSSNGNSPIALSLAFTFIFIVYGLFLVKEHTCKTIDIRYTHLIDDLDRFNAYHWGSIVYNFLVKETHRLKVKLADTIASGNKLNVDVHEFVYALL